MSTAWSRSAWSLVMDVLKEIQGREKEDPYQIDEVPEEARVLDPVGEPHRIRLPQLRARTPEVGIDQHPADHVKPVQSGQREIDGEKVVGTGEEVMFELGGVFEVLHDEEDQSEQD